MGTNCVRGSALKGEKPAVRPVVEGGCIGRISIVPDRRWVRFTMRRNAGPPIEFMTPPIEDAGRKVSAFG
ncbi:MAG: hypothetical protein NT047_11070 [Deltaproteobacteria bacterium]|nr:hypothetical protein [Deltaproteobacteria bacterium]